MYASVIGRARAMGRTLRPKGGGRTPVTADPQRLPGAEDVDILALENLAAEVLDAGASGLVALSTTGEVHALSSIRRARKPRRVRIWDVTTRR